MNASLNFDISPSDPANPLGVEVWINDTQLADYPALDQLQHISCVFDDDVEQNHTIKIVVKNKTAEHTQLSESGEILRDSLVTINNFKLDDVEIEKIVHEKAVYKHNFNGYGNAVSESFYGSAGCNGSIELEFSSPSYIWVLENM